MKQLGTLAYCSVLLRKTPGFILYIALVQILSFYLNSLSFADSATRKAEEKAYADFYREVKSLGRNPSIEAIKSTEKRVVAPAVEANNRANQSEIRPKQVPLNVRNLSPKEKKEKQEKAASKFRHDLLLFRAFKESKGKGIKGLPGGKLPDAALKAAAGKKLNLPPKDSGPSTGGGLPMDSGPSRPEEQLDGSGIPKEVEFKRRTPAPAKPAQKKPGT